MSEPSTRDRLIDAAFRVVAREGLEAASVKSIAAEAGVTPGLMHYHFPCKEALMEAALRRGLEEYVEVSRARRAKHSGEALLDAFFADARAAATVDADFFRVRLAFAARALTHPALAVVLRTLTDAAVEETALTLAAAAGRDVPTDHDRLTARALKAAFDGYMLAALTDPAFPLEGAARLLVDAVGRSRGP
ncbi:MAG: TetR/AcrR family transcriptional regulator [Hyphomonadaceae bacterium]|nr:TetR/AcrR family transcriptional regulator [Hyphomonadaceae bacterium]